VATTVPIYYPVDDVFHLTVQAVFDGNLAIVSKNGERRPVGCHSLFSIFIRLTAGVNCLILPAIHDLLTIVYSVVLEHCYYLGVLLRAGAIAVRCAASSCRRYAACLPENVLPAALCLPADYLFFLARYQHGALCAA